MLADKSVRSPRKLRILVIKDNINIIEEAQRRGFKIKKKKLYGAERTHSPGPAGFGSDWRDNLSENSRLQRFADQAGLLQWL